MPSKKKPNQREQTKHSAVKPQLNLRSRWEELQDLNEYYHELPPDAQEWLNTYAENFINADFSEKTVLTESNTKLLLKQYIKEIKNYNNEKKVKDFVSKYLIRVDNIPVKIIKEMFFEADEKKLLVLVEKLKEAITENITKASKREVNKVIKMIQKEVYNVNNARNRCIITRTKAQGSLNYIEELSESDHYSTDEDDLINKIDLEKSLKNLKK